MKDYNTPSVELFSELQWVTFPESVHYHQALFKPLNKFKFLRLNNLAPPFMKNIFQYAYVTDVCNTNLWSAANLKYGPKTHPKGTWISGPIIWKNLQPDARSAKSLHNFKQLYQKNSQSIKQSYLWLHGHVVYIIVFSVVCLMSVPCVYYALCCVLNVCTLYILCCLLCT